jgi:predicted PurR-regulated permease PerM
MNPSTQKIARPPGTQEIAGKVAALIAVIGLFLFSYFFFEIVLLTIGAVIVAVVVLLIAAPFKDWLKLNRWVAITLSILILAAVVTGTAYLFGTRLAVDFQDVFSRMEEAQNRIRAALESSGVGKMLLSHMGSANIPLGHLLTSIFSISTRVVADVIVAVIAGIYLAAQPHLYLNGFLMLFPHERRANAEETIIAIGHGLYRWLEGQFIEMLLVGLLSFFAWWAIGLPSPLGLGLIAGVTEFIPYVGPIIAAIPALLVAATQGLSTVLWTFVVYLAIHGIEGNVIAPLIQRELAYVPPALMLLGIAAITIVFGTAAILFAAPIIVMLFVLVKKIYVRDALGERTPLPGEDVQR